tara:strand:- start:213 stop:1391 length:1179 start_codon:yes stop_codon:yes gene_type:complete
MKLIHLVVLLFFIKPVFGEIYSEQYGSIKLSGTSFVQDTSNDNRKNTKIDSELEYNIYLEKDNIEFKIQSKIKFGNPSLRDQINFNEAYVSGYRDNFDYLIGNNIIFWGKSEFFNPVDVINSQDFSKGLNKGEKIGQPMVNFKRYLDIGDLDLYLLYPTKNIYPLEKIRSQITLNFDDYSKYSNGASSTNPGIGIRLSGYRGDIDYGLSMYNGNTKDPGLFIINGKIVPNYSKISQIGFDFQLTRDSHLYKSEIIYRSDQFDSKNILSNYYASNLGYEKTIFNFLERNWDLGLIAEHAYDSRGRTSHTGFQNDLFLGTTLALNDIQDTQSRFIVINDLDRQTRSMTITYESRFFSLIRGGAEVYYPFNLENDLHNASFKDEINILFFTKYSF